MLQPQEQEQQLQEEQQQEPEYITNAAIDLILRRGKDKLKHAITVSDDKLTKTKKQIVKEMARDLENAKYPLNQICDKLSKYLKGLVHESTVRDALEAKYKNPEQSQAALGQNHGGADHSRQQEQVKEKDVKDIGLDDIKSLGIQKARQVAKHQMSKALYLDQQAKQDKEKIKELTEQLKESDELLASFVDIFVKSENFSDADIAKSVRSTGKFIMQKFPDLKPKPTK